MANLAPAPPVRWPEAGNGNFYEFVPINPFQPLSWEQARSAAAGRSHQGLPGHLATITSAAEQAFVGSISNPPTSPGYYFLGGVQAEGAGARSEGWSSVTGEPWQSSPP